MVLQLGMYALVMTIQVRLSLKLPVAIFFRAAVVLRPLGIVPCKVSLFVVQSNETEPTKLAVELCTFRRRPVLSALVVPDRLCLASPGVCRVPLLRHLL